MRVAEPFLPRCAAMDKRRGLNLGHVLVIALAAATTIACAAALAAPYAPQEFDFSGLDRVPYGTVELVQPAPPSPTEQAQKAEAARLRLHVGRSITVVLRSPPTLDPGDRVRAVRVPDA